VSTREDRNAHLLSLARSIALNRIDAHGAWVSISLIGVTLNGIRLRKASDGTTDLVFPRREMLNGRDVPIFTIDREIQDQIVKKAHILWKQGIASGETWLRADFTEADRMP
jgi:hypothetical protein